MVDFISEPDPLEIMKSLIEDNWKATEEVEKPQIEVINDPEDPRLRISLNEGDVVLIKMDGTEMLKQRANFQYYDKVFPMSIEIYSKISRQRMKDIGKMVRMICNDNKHNFEGYQLIRYTGQDESIEENLNIWRYRFRVQVEANRLCAESLI